MPISNIACRWQIDDRANLQYLLFSIDTFVLNEMSHISLEAHHDHAINPMTRSKADFLFRFIFWDFIYQQNHSKICYRRKPWIAISCSCMLKFIAIFRRNIRDEKSNIQNCYWELLIICCSLILYVFLQINYIYYIKFYFSFIYGYEWFCSICNYESY